MRLNQKTWARVRPASPQAGGIVGIEDREILSLLILEDAGLGVGVGLERAVAVEVVGRNVEHHRNFWTKRLDRLQLEARYLEDHNRVRLRGPDQGDRRRANIAADRCGKASSRDDFTRQSCGRGLSVGTCYGDDVPGQKLRRQLNLADHELTHSAGLHQGRGIHGDAGADHDEILSAEGAFAVSAGFDRDAVIEQDRNLFAQLVLRLGVRNRDFRPSRLQEQGGGHARLAQADDQNAFVGEIHRLIFQPIPRRHGGTE